ncbi:MAG: 4Fe-4S binding protein [Bacillota bacterium]|nr:4Fe-4S binding protein [Bacillota bacterium]
MSQKNSTIQSNKETALSEKTAAAARAHFKAPEDSAVIMDKMLTEDEQLFISAAEPDRDYEPREIEELFYGCSQNPEPEPQDPVLRLYHRGVIDPGEKEGAYRIGNFWSRLDIFATEELDLYMTIPEDIRLKTEDAYLKRYEESLWDADPEKLNAAGGFRPTEDEVLPIEDVLTFIDGKDEQAYLADCDCRSLRQACKAPRDLCITYRTGPYSFVRRGLAKPITKEEAREIVLRSEKEGLVHTINPGGVCSCCTDCCYLFRTAEDKGCLGTWPKVSYRIELDADACVGCGRCLERCRFGVLSAADGPEKNVKPEQKSRVFIADIDRCQGCGLCRSTCPADALRLIRI